MSNRVEKESRSAREVRRTLGQIEESSLKINRLSSELAAEEDWRQRLIEKIKSIVGSAGGVNS